MADISFDDLIPKTQQGGGLTFDDLVPPPVDTATDVAKSGGTGLLKGSLSLPTTLSDLSGALDYGLSWAGAKAAGALGLLPEGKTADDLINAAQKMNLPEARFSSPTSQSVLNAVQQDVTGPLYQPQTTAGKYAETVGSFVPGALAMGAGNPVARLSVGTATPVTRTFTAPLANATVTTTVGPRIAAQAGPAAGSSLPSMVASGASAVPAGLLSEFVGQRLEGSPYETAGRLAGAAVGGNIPGLLSRTITPLPADPRRLPLLATAEREGIPLTAGQATGYKPLQYVESELSNLPLGGGKAHEIEAAQKEAFQSAAMRRTGAPEGTTTSPTDMANTYRDLQGGYKDLTSRNNVTFDEPLGSDILKTARAYDADVAIPQQSPIVGTRMREIIEHPDEVIPGVQYQKWRSDLTDDMATHKADGPTYKALKGVRDALDNAMSRSVSPEDAATWKDLNKRYAAYKTIEDAVGSGGAQAVATGELTPAQLTMAVKNRNRGAFVRGQEGGTDLVDLAKAGGGLMSSLPQSGTAPRTVVHHALEGAGTLIGGLLGNAHAGPTGAVGGAIAGRAVLEPLLGLTAGRAIMSPLTQQYFGNQLMTRAGLAGIGQGPYFGLLGANPSIQDRRSRGLLQ